MRSWEKTLTNEQANVLEEIIDLGGECLENNRCIKCPFKNDCLPKFAEEDGPWSHKTRMNLAINTLTREVLMGDTYESP